MNNPKPTGSVVPLILGIFLLAIACLIFNAPPDPGTQGIAANLAFIDNIAPAFLVTILGLISLGIFIFGNKQQVGKSIAGNSEFTENEALTRAMDSGESLMGFAEKADSMSLTDAPEDFYKAGLAHLEKGSFDDAILEFVKTIKATLPRDGLYDLARKELMNMGFSEADISRVNQKK